MVRETQQKQAQAGVRSTEGNRAMFQQNLVREIWTLSCQALCIHVHVQHMQGLQALDV